MSPSESSAISNPAGEIFAELGEQSPTRLNEQVSWNLPLQKLRSYIIQSDDFGLPRFGVLSILARRTPFHLYDHKALVALCETAFTDGTQIFINTEFFKSLINTTHIERINNQHHSMILILLHELSHILFRHHARMPPQAPPLLWSIATDIAINIRLLKAYNFLQPGDIFESAWGTRPEEIERYADASEEHILFDLWDNPLAAARPFVEALKNTLKEDLLTPIAKEQDERGSAQDIHRHMIDADKLAEVFDSNDLSHIRQRLKMPDPNDKPAYQELDVVNQLNLSSDIQTSADIRRNTPSGGSMKGDHLETAYAESVNDEHAATLSWQTRINNVIFANGTHYEHNDEIPDDIYYISPEQMGLNAPLYIGSPIPASPSNNIVCVIDTSGSVPKDMLQSFIGEISNLVTIESSNINQLYLFAADTSIRGSILEFSQDERLTLPENLEVEGRGGTDIGRVLKEVFSWVENKDDFKQEDFHTLIYFSDLIDKPPVRDVLPENLPNIIFLSPPSLQIKSFKRAVEAFAEVAEIREGTVIDLCKY
jgi:predicted metal-dependent peptidase